MSTRGLIAVMDDDGSCRSIYVHNDMHESHAGKILAEHYATRKQTERLLALGDLSVLCETPETCVAYCRDRGEELHAPTQWSDRWQLAREAFDRFWANYSYLLIDGVWHVSDGGPWIPVESEEE